MRPDQSEGDQCPKLRGLPDNTANPHLWYDPRTMPAVAKAVGGRFAALQPAQAAYFQSNAGGQTSLKPWYAAIAAFKTKSGKIPVAVTEPVADTCCRRSAIISSRPSACKRRS